jgi:hypothetical protein
MGTRALKGHGLTGCGKTRSLKGTGFSPKNSFFEGYGIQPENSFFEGYGLQPEKPVL